MVEKHPQQLRDENTAKLLRYMFHKRFCAETNVEQAQKGFILPAYFFGWLDKTMNETSVEQADTICEESGVSDEIWDFLKNMVNGGLAVERTHQLWYTIVLGDRPQPTAAVKSCNLVMLITFEDGRIWPTQTFVTRELLPTDSPGFDDGLLGSIISKNVSAFTETIVIEGLDQLHDKATNFRGHTPEDPYDIFMGMILKFMPQIDAQYHEHIKNYMRLTQAVIRPPIPPQIRMQLEQAKQAQERSNKPRGGWDA